MPLDTELVRTQQADPHQPAELFSHASARQPLRETVRLTSIGGFRCESGAWLENVVLAWESWGRLNAAGDNAVVVLHALTGDSHAHGTEGDPGWWDALIGPGGAIDTEKHFVISINMLGGCNGSTGPLSIDQSTGRRYGGDFPEVSIRDSVIAERRLLESLGVTRVRGVLGGSMGGARALEWAVTHADIVERCGVIASTAASSAEQIALCGIQCETVRMDPAFRGGHYEPEEQPVRGLSLARQIAHLSYRTEAELEYRFSRCSQPSGAWAGRYSVESYLERQGEKLVARFDANSYLRLTQALMGHDIGRGRGGVKAALDSVGHIEFFIASVESDRLYLPGQSLRLARAVGADHVSIMALNGHDAFLTHAQHLEDDVRAFME